MITINHCCCLLDVIFPIGSFRLQASVYDTNSASITVIYDTQCNIELQFSNNNNSTQICNNLNSVINDLSFVNSDNEVQSTYSKYLIYFQSMESILQYINGILINDVNGNNINDACVFDLLSNILDSIYSQFEPNNTDLCQTDYTTVAFRLFAFLFLFVLVSKRF